MFIDRLSGNLHALAYPFQSTLSAAVGQQPIVTDSHKPSGQHMHQEAADKLAALQGKDFVLVIPVVFVTEAHLTLIHIDNAPLTDSDFMTVAGQIPNHTVGMVQAVFAINHPIALHQLIQTPLYLG